ncbi:hypothetical protein OHO28_38590 [Streptomyces europaeiscabiei]|uniref:hypothetical protein n=1 Tax=Streptomyces europaeiscabiei TaxID=146819 RepID=UPI002E18681C
MAAEDPLADHPFLWVTRLSKPYPANTGVLAEDRLPGASSLRRSVQLSVNIGMLESAQPVAPSSTHARLPQEHAPF